QTVCSTPTATANRAACGLGVLTAPVLVGSYAGSASPYRTVDQGGNLSEWNEAIINTINRRFRGGAYANVSTNHGAAGGGMGSPTLETNTLGFRVVLVPEPGTGLLVVAGLLGLAFRRAKH